jgi:hypothetical protein
MALNQGIYTASEIGDIIGEPLNRVGNHIRELSDAGSIEIADTKRRRNTRQHLQAVGTTFFSEREAKTMTSQEPLPGDRRRPRRRRVIATAQRFVFRLVAQSRSRRDRAASSVPRPPM